MMIALTAIIALSTICQAIMAGLQNRNMRRTMEETRKAAEATAGSADAANRQATTARQSLELAAQLGGMQAADTRSTIQLAERNAKAAEDAARAALDAAELSSRQLKQAALLDRPWLAFEHIDVTGLLEILDSYRFDGTTVPVNNQIVFRYALKNGGRSVARVIDFGIRLSTGGPLKPEPEYPGSQIAEQLWVPGFSVTQVIGQELPGLMLRDLTTGVRMMALYGHIVYRGPIEGIPDYESRFCMVLVCNEWEPSKFIFGGPDAYNRYT